MARVQITSVHPTRRFVERSSDGLGTVQFCEEEPAEWLVAYDDIPPDLKTRIPRERRIAAVTEPPGFRTYWSSYLDQFGIVLTAFETTPVSGIRIISNPGMGWLYGVNPCGPGRRNRFTRQELLDLAPPVKTKSVSAVLSTKTRLPMHRRRLEFALRLKDRLKDRFDLFGQGFQPIPDKRLAIDDYRYHLSLENTTEGHFWTEKLADPLLGWSLPLFCGCQAADQYFPAGSFIRLNLDGDLDPVVDQVERILEEDPYEHHLPAIAEARRRVILDHQLSAIVGRVIETMSVDTSVLLPDPDVLRSNVQARPIHAHLIELPRRWKRGLERVIFTRSIHHKPAGKSA